MKRLFYLLPFILSFSSCNMKSPEGEWQLLFDGNSLNGWTVSEREKGRFSVENGYLKCIGSDAYLIHDETFKNFEFEASVKTEKQCESVLFFHADFRNDSYSDKGYKVKINNTIPAGYAGNDHSQTGSLLKIRNVYFPVAENHQWFRLRVKVIENRIQIFVNDQIINDYIEPHNPWRWEGGEKVKTGEGRFAIKSPGSENAVWFREIRVKSLPEGEQFPPKVSKEWDTAVTKLNAEGFPLIDYHVHLKGGLKLNEVTENSLNLGINYGIAPNCGLYFPVTNDSSLHAYLTEVKKAPAFKGMQAEGREWVKLFSPKAIRQFDYVFTDAMTFTDEKGRRNRIWIPEEVWVEDEQYFMDQMVDKIEAIFSQEPVDIYVNPTVLPDELADDYDQLWTADRKQQVIDVLAKNGVALEINARYELPKADMIKMAKNAGVKFTFGTNNTGKDLGHLEYCLKIIEECDLQTDDMYYIKPDSLKPIVLKGLPTEITG